VVQVSSQQYDDGSHDVPGGVAGPVERVVVVGAGIAGLTVANALAHVGVECVVLEARERVGGRLHTVDLGGAAVDLGASWIHHPVGNPLRALADQLGVTCRDGNPLPTLSGYDRAEERRLSRAEVEAHLTMLYDDFTTAVGQRQAAVGAADLPVSQVIQEFVTDSDMGSADARRAMQGLRAVIEAEAADRVERQSLRWMWTEDDYDGEYFGDLPEGGYRRIVDGLSAGLDVRTGVVVDGVEWSDSGVRIATADGGTETASHVVVTVPLGVLQAGAVTFTPQLPPERSAAVARLGFGRLEKVVLRFDQPFWRAAGLSHLMVFPPDANRTTAWILDLEAFGGEPVLSSFVFHSDAVRLEGDPQQSLDWVLDMLSAATGVAVPAPTAVEVTAWAADPYSRGAYTHIPPGADPEDIDLLGRPIGGRVLFAGEHTQSARVAYADGAMSSGIREAKRLLGRASVTLGRLPGARS